MDSKISMTFSLTTILGAMPNSGTLALLATAIFVLLAAGMAGFEAMVKGFFRSWKLKTSESERNTYIKVQKLGNSQYPFPLFWGDFLKMTVICGKVG